MKYYPRLDSIRAIAAFLVILNHWTPESSWFHKTPLAMIGVIVFFVLSGFLISLILFINFKKSNDLGIPKSQVLKRFYLKRILRIMPIYFLYLFLVYLFRHQLGVPKDAFFYLATYTSNLYMYYHQEWLGFLSSLWTLAVEEQFYLIFPFLYLCLNRKLFLFSIALLTIIGVIVPIIYKSKMIEIHTYSCLDAFGLGILYAYLYYEGKNIMVDWIVRIIGFIALLLIVLKSLYIFPIHIDYYFLTALFTVSLISMIVNDEKILSLDFLLNLKVFQFLGKISYGIYLYHTLVGKLYVMIIGRLQASNSIVDQEFWFSFPVSFTFKMTSLLAISFLSWICIEKRILIYKNRMLNLK